MTGSFRDESHDEEPAVLESEVKGSLKALGRNKLLWVDRILPELFQTSMPKS